MKKLIIIFLITVATVTESHAVTKCLALNSSTRCSGGTASVGTIEWSANCSTGNTAFTISGIAACSSLNANSGTAANSLPTVTQSETDPEGVKFCWCKTTSPVVSRWIKANVPSEYTNLRNCLATCSTFCHDYILSMASYLYTIF